MLNCWIIAEKILKKCFIYQESGCKVRPLQIAGAHTCSSIWILREIRSIELKKYWLYKQHWKYFCSNLLGDVHRNQFMIAFFKFFLKFSKEHCWQRMVWHCMILEISLFFGIKRAFWAFQAIKCLHWINYPRIDVHLFFTEKKLECYFISVIIYLLWRYCKIRTHQQFILHN